MLRARGRRRAGRRSDRHSLRPHRHRGQQRRHASARAAGRRRDDAMLEHFKTKVLGPWELARRVAPHMRKQGGGRFIVIIGQTGKVPQANAIASTIINAAQHAFVKSLSDDLAPDNILVNAVCPSRIKSPLTDAPDALQRGLSRPQPRAAGSALGRRGAARPLGHARRHRQRGRCSSPRSAPASSAAPISTSMAATSDDLLRHRA